MSGMNALEVCVNGKRVYAAGSPPTGWLSGSVNWTPRLGRPGLLGVILSGRDLEVKEHLLWPITRLNPGDEVTIRVVDTDVIDPPSRRVPIKYLDDENPQSG